MRAGDLKRMFNPETMPLIGATEEDLSVGRHIFENLYYWSKERKLFPVNPKQTPYSDEMLSSILEVPEHVDLSVVATPARSVPAIVQDCGQAEVDGIIILVFRFSRVARTGRDWKKR